MLSSKTAAPLKGVFDQAKANAAEAVMQPAPVPKTRELRTLLPG